MPKRTRKLCTEQDVNPLLSVTKQECKEVAFDMMKFDGKSGIIALKHRPMYSTSASQQQMMMRTMLDSG